MLPKYTVEYVPRVPKHSPTIHYSTDDPIACEEFVEELLSGGFRIEAIKHEGLDLPKQDFDRMIKTAAATTQHVPATAIKPSFKNCCPASTPFEGATVVA